jgi:hypothetical protein
MPWSNTYTESGVDCRFTGATHGAEIYAANDAIFVHTYADRFRYAIVDFTLVESLDLPTADLLRIAEGDRQYLLRNPSYALVMIAPQGVIFGRARTFERFMEGSTLRSTVVQNREQALAWLRSEGFEV